MPNVQHPGIPPEHIPVVQAVNSGKNLFITGGAGTGKSRLARLLASEAEKNGLRVTRAAPTGIVAEAIGGCTLHRLLALSGSLTDADDKGNPCLARGSVKALLNTDILFIDEISMVSRPLFDILSHSIQAVRENGCPIQLIVSGDFYQLPPVIPPSEKEILRSLYADPDRLYAFDSDYWDSFDFLTIQLNRNYRQDDPAACSLLDRLRRGEWSAVPLFLKLTAKRPVRNAVWLCGRKADAAAHNKAELAKMAGEPSFYHAITQGRLAEDRLPAPLLLEIKPAMPVMMTVNDPKGRFFNGSRGYVISTGTDCIYISLYGSQGRVRVGRYTWKIQGAPGQELSFSQFPLIPAFALTVHRAQGLTLDAANILPYSWEPGQLYVMLSRAANPSRVFIGGVISRDSLIASPAVHAFYSGFSRPSLSGDRIIESASAAAPGPLPSKRYRRGLRFGVYSLHFSFQGQQLSRSFIALRDRAGRWLGVTDFHKYVKPSSRVRPVSSDTGGRLYFVTYFLNYLFIDSGCVDSLEDLTVEMARTFLCAYAAGSLGEKKRTAQTINTCVNTVIQFMLAILEDSSLDLIFTRDDLFQEQYYFSRGNTLGTRQVLAFSIQYDPDSHLLLRDMPQRAAQILLSHIYAFHPDILLATALQLFAGLRPSEPLAIHEGCLKIRRSGDSVTSVSIDLTKERVLRTDGVKTGRIKKHRKAAVYPAFLQAFSDCYRRYQEACGMHSQEYGSGSVPLCVDRGGRAMTYKTYYRRFKSAVREAIPLLASDDDPDIREYAALLMEEGAAPHIWRHVFTQVLVLSGLSEAQIMAARGDSSPASALAYLNRKSELMKQYSETAARIADQMMEAARAYMGGAV